MVLTKKINIRDSNFFDLYDEKQDKLYHGNYQGARDNTAVVKYVTKESNYVSSYSEDYINAQKKSRANKSSLVGELIL